MQPDRALHEELKTLLKAERMRQKALMDRHACIQADLDRASAAINASAGRAELLETMIRETAPISE